MKHPAYDVVCLLKLLWFGLVINMCLIKCMTVVLTVVGVVILSMAAAAVISCIQLEKQVESKETNQWHCSGSGRNREI